MENILALTKIGNIKIGAQSKNGPIALDRFLITEATKDGEENFKIYPNTKEEGYTKINITLPFNQPELNFEVGKIAFYYINNKEYMLKLNEKTGSIIAIPLSVDAEPILIKEEAEELDLQLYNLEEQGLLRAYIDGFSGIGEVFFFKTKSKNTITAIQNQLKILHSLTGGILAFIPLELKIHQKDSTIVVEKDGELLKQSKKYSFVTITNSDAINNGIKGLSDCVERVKESTLNVKAFEELYIKSREITKADEEKFLTLEDLKKSDNFSIMWSELAELKSEAPKDEVATEEDTTEKDVVAMLSKKIRSKDKVKAIVDKFPIQVLKTALEKNYEEAVKILRKKDTTLADIIKLK
jgi:hypothetical protein